MQRLRSIHSYTNYRSYLCIDYVVLISVVPAVLGLTAAAILAVTACFCARRFRRQKKKAGHEVSSLPFQPPRPPRAVRSPSGQPPQYLKKSPSPTGIKPPPGGHLPAQSPTEQSCIPTNPTATITTTTTKYSEENELTPKKSHLEPKSPDGDTLDGNDNETEYGKLGSIVFKLRYLADRNALVVSVVRCRGLPGKNSNSSNGSDPSVGPLCNGNGNIKQTATDPYVKLQLLPDKQHKVKTR